MPEKEKEMQEKYFEMQIIGQQMKQLQQQAMAVETQIAELDISMDGIKNIKKANVDDAVMFPITPGIFLRGSLKDNRKCIVNVGAGTAVEKTIEDAAEMLESQKQELARFREEIFKNLQLLEKRAMELEEEFQK